jgi:hypothetical protein
MMEEESNLDLSQAYDDCIGVLHHSRDSSWPQRGVPSDEIRGHLEGVFDIL